MVPALTSTQSQGPRRHFRGKKRYFRRIHREAASYRLEFGPDIWWDHWHYHTDWPGWGNHKWRYRLEHIRASVEVFRSIARDANKFTTPFQTWIYLSGRDAGEDATFLHTPNANQTPFPLQLLGPVDWEHRELLTMFGEMLPEFPLRIGECRFFDQWAEPPRMTTSFFIYSPGVGVPLEPREV